ncbi:MAG: NERD domain-containing protein/DEAD/DEAH box helicase [Thermodesulfobacteriota bacterium]
MALMIPVEVRDFTTEGEGRFYRFLATVAKPDAAYQAWYLPDINGKEPDFILYSDAIGLIIFEVKDWVLDQIREANPHQFVLDINGQASPRKNPFHQAREYVSELKHKISADGKLVATDPIHRGNPRIPISMGVVLPNVNKHEYVEKKLDAVIPADKIFFWDDLHPQSDICSDRSGKCFSAALSERFAPLFKFTVSHADRVTLRQLLFPEVRIDLPDRGRDSVHLSQAERLRLLDNCQEALARQFDGGHRIIIGPSGSGKTLILAHKAVFLQKYNPAVKNILFVCYNIPLVNYIRGLLAAKAVPLGEPGVRVCHFYELCADIIGEKISFENEEPGYYDIIIQEALSRVGAFGKTYDAILLDEGQDFSPDMFRVITGLLSPVTSNLTIALDENQNIYHPGTRWSELGIQARGRVHRLTPVYRNTVEIAGFAARFIGSSPVPADAPEDPQMPLFCDPYVFHGPPPELCRFETLDLMTAGIARRAADLVRQEGYPFSEIAFLFAMKKPDKTRTDTLPEMLEDALSQQGILSQWMSEDLRSKKSYDITTNRAVISTIHSAKGLDYSVVFLLGLDCLAPKAEGWTREQIDRLIYVGITRARYRLIIPYVEDRRIVERLKNCL